MNVKTHRKGKRSVSGQVMSPLACAFGLKESLMMNSGSEFETSARHGRSPTGMVHIDIPRKLKQSLTVSDGNDSAFQFGKSTKRRGKKKSEPKKEASTKTFQSTSTHSSAYGTRACYRLPSRKRLSKKLQTQKSRSTKESRDDISFVSASSSSCLTDSSHNDGNRESSIDSDSEMGDRYAIAEFGSDQRGIMFPSTQSFYHVQDCYEEQDALVLQLHIPSLHQHAECLDVEYLPFRIPAIKSDMV